MAELSVTETTSTEDIRKNKEELAKKVLNMEGADLSGMSDEELDNLFSKMDLVESVKKLEGTECIEESLVMLGFNKKEASFILKEMNTKKEYMDFSKIKENFDFEEIKKSLDDIEDPNETVKEHEPTDEGKDFTKYCKDNECSVTALGEIGKEKLPESRIKKFKEEDRTLKDRIIDFIINHEDHYDLADRAETVTGDVLEDIRLTLENYDIEDFIESLEEAIETYNEFGDLDDTPYYANTDETEEEVVEEMKFLVSLYNEENKFNESLGDDNLSKLIKSFVVDYKIPVEELDSNFSNLEEYFSSKSTKDIVEDLEEIINDYDNQGDFTSEDFKGSVDTANTIRYLINAYYKD